MIKTRPNIGIVGAGVVGLSVSLRILQAAPTSKVTIIADRYGNDTTTAGAAGVWGPYKMMETPVPLVDRLAMDSYHHLMGLFHSRDAMKAGVSLVQSHYLYESGPEPLYPSWKDKVYGLKDLTREQLALFPTSKAEFGFTFDNVTVEGRYYLAYLEEQIKQIGGNHAHFVHRRLKSLDEIEGQFDAIVDCSGLGARSLVNDDLVVPIRGQIIRVEAPWITNHYNYGDYYIIPNPHHGSVVLGGTGQQGSFDTTISREDRDRILQGCTSLIPSLADAKVKDDWVGLRPGRRQLRLEIQDKGRTIHCYGHGGAGLTLGWGCAGDVVGMLIGLGARPELRELSNKIMHTDAQFDGLVADVSALANKYTNKRDKVAAVRVKNWLLKLSEKTTNERWQKNRNQYLRLLLSQLISSDGGRLSLMPPFDLSPPEGSLPTLSPHLLYRFSDSLYKSTKQDSVSEEAHTHLTVKPQLQAAPSSPSLHPPAESASALTAPSSLMDSNKDVAAELDGLLGKMSTTRAAVPAQVAPVPKPVSKEEANSLLRLRLNRLSESAERLRLKREHRIKSASELNKSLPTPVASLPPPPYALSRLMIKRVAAEEIKQHDPNGRNSIIQEVSTRHMSYAPHLMKRLDASKSPPRDRQTSPPRMIRPLTEGHGSIGLGHDRRYSSPTIRERSGVEDGGNKDHEDKVEDILNKTASPTIPSPPSSPQQDPRMNIAPIPRPVYIASPVKERESPPSVGSFSFAIPDKGPRGGEGMAPSASIAFFHTDRFSSPGTSRPIRPEPFLPLNAQGPNVMTSAELTRPSNTPEEAGRQAGPSKAGPRQAGPSNTPEEAITKELLSIESRADECKRRVTGIWKLPSMCGDAFSPPHDDGRHEASERQRQSKQSVKQLGRAFLQLGSFIDLTRRAFFGSQPAAATQNKVNQAGRRQRDISAPHSRAVNSSPNASWRPGGRAPPSPLSPLRSESPLLDEAPYHRFISSSHGKVPPGLPLTSPPLSPVGKARRESKPLNRACSVGRGGDGSRAMAVIRAIETLEGEICELANALVRLSLSAPSPLQQTGADGIASGHPLRAPLRPFFQEVAEAASRDHLINQRMVAEQEVKMEADKVKRTMLESCQKMVERLVKSLVKRAAGMEVEEVWAKHATLRPPSIAPSVHHATLPPPSIAPSVHHDTLRPPSIAPSHKTGLRGGSILPPNLPPSLHAVVRPLDLNQALPADHRPSSLLSDRVTGGRYHDYHDSLTFKPVMSSGSTFKPVTFKPVMSSGSEEGIRVQSPTHTEPSNFLSSPPQMALPRFIESVATYDGRTDVTGRPAIPLLPPRLRENLLREGAAPSTEHKGLPTYDYTGPAEGKASLHSQAPVPPEIRPLASLPPASEKDFPAPAPATSFVKNQVEAALEALGRTLSALAPLGLNKQIIYKPTPPPPPLYPSTPSLGTEMVRREIAKFREDYASVKTMHPAEPSVGLGQAMGTAYLPVKDPASLRMALRDSESFNREIFERFQKLKTTLNLNDEESILPASYTAPMAEHRAVEGQRVGLQERLKVLHGLTSELQNRLSHRV